MSKNKKAQYVNNVEMKADFMSSKENIETETTNLDESEGPAIASYGEEDGNNTDIGTLDVIFPEQTSQNIPEDVTYTYHIQIGPFLNSVKAEEQRGKLVCQAGVDSNILHVISDTTGFWLEAGVANVAVEARLKADVINLPNIRIVKEKDVR